MKFLLGAAIALASLFSVPGSSVDAAELVMTDSRACPYCRQFHREVGDTYAATPAGKVAPLRPVSVYKKWPDDLAGIRRAPYTPVFILVDNGREVGRFAGYKSRAWFWSKLNPLLAKLN